jgi:hypothetical protein
VFKGRLKGYTCALPSKEEGSGALFGGPRDMVACGCGGGGGVAWVDGSNCRVFACARRFIICASSESTVLELYRGFRCATGRVKWFAMASRCGAVDYLTTLGRRPFLMFHHRCASSPSTGLATTTAQSLLSTRLSRP